MEEGGNRLAEKIPLLGVSQAPINERNGLVQLLFPGKEGNVSRSCPTCGNIKYIVLPLLLLSSFLNS